MPMQMQCFVPVFVYSYPNAVAGSHHILSLFVVYSVVSPHFLFYIHFLTACDRERPFRCFAKVCIVFLSPFDHTIE